MAQYNDTKQWQKLTPIRQSFHSLVGLVTPVVLLTRLMEAGIEALAILLLVQ